MLWQTRQPPRATGQRICQTGATYLFICLLAPTKIQRLSTECNSDVHFIISRSFQELPAHSR